MALNFSLIERKIVKQLKVEVMAMDKTFIIEGSSIIIMELKFLMEPKVAIIIITMVRIIKLLHILFCDIFCVHNNKF